MNWLTRMFTRDHEQTARLDAAHAQRADAAEELADARELGARNRRHVQNNHFGERIAAAFYANDRQERT